MDSRNDLASRAQPRRAPAVSNSIAPGRLENINSRGSPSIPIFRPRPPKTWAYRFHLIDKAGGARLPHWRRLSASELLVVLFNPRSLFFGPLYFVWLGMWRRGLAIGLLGLVLPAALLQLLKELHPLCAGLELEALLAAGWAWCLLAWVVGALVGAALRVNLDYYRHWYTSVQRRLVAKYMRQGGGR